MITVDVRAKVQELIDLEYGSTIVKESLHIQLLLE